MENRIKMKNHKRSADIEGDQDQPQQSVRRKWYPEVPLEAIPLPTAELEMSPNNNLNPYSFMDMPGDPGTFGGMGNYCPYPSLNGQENVLPPKEVLQFASCVLIPPNPNAPQLTTRNRPLGCKTVLVKGFPEKITEDIIKEVFSKFLEIVTIRINKKNFCHIRFSSEMYVDSALFLSGYQIKIENKDESPYSGQMHVDYAIDHYDYEIAKRALEREQRHQWQRHLEQLKQQNFQAQTPPPIDHYSKQQITTLAEKLEDKASFKKEVQVLISWLERGGCNKKNVSYFYSMIQSTNNHVHRLMNEKETYEDELNNARKLLRKKMLDICSQFLDIVKVFDAVKLKKVWDHFTKPQRKNIKLMEKQLLEIQKAYSDELIDELVEDEMEVSDGEESSEGKAGNEKCVRMEEENNKLKEENNNLKEENNKLKEGNNKMKEENNNLKEEIKSLQVQLSAVQNNENQLKNMIEQKNMNLFETELMLKMVKGKPRSINSETHMDLFAFSTCSDTPEIRKITVNETRIIALIAIFLNAHRFGVSINYICSFLNRSVGNLNTRKVEDLMKKFPTIFREDASGKGATLKKEWFIVYPET